MDYQLTHSFLKVYYSEALLLTLWLHLCCLSSAKYSSLLRQGLKPAGPSHRLVARGAARKPGPEGETSIPSLMRSFAKLGLIVN